LSCRRGQQRRSNSPADGNVLQVSRQRRAWTQVQRMPRQPRRRGNASREPPRARRRLASRTRGTRSVVGRSLRDVPQGIVLRELSRRERAGIACRPAPRGSVSSERASRRLRVAPLARGSIGSGRVLDMSPAPDLSGVPHVERRRLERAAQSTPSGVGRLDVVGKPSRPRGASRSGAVRQLSWRRR
jgi:hypothetical protein